MSKWLQFIENSIGYSSCIADQFWPKTEVTKFALAEGHTFPDNKTLLMQIGEEANLFDVRHKIVRRYSFQVMFVETMVTHSMLLVTMAPLH